MTSLNYGAYLYHRYMKKTGASILTKHLGNVF